MNMLLKNYLTTLLLLLFTHSLSHIFDWILYSWLSDSSQGPRIVCRKVSGNVVNGDHVIIVGQLWH